ncbi:MAG: porin family protein [Alphaproteobacteria bacterium]|nr:porin family protein [Alphaproteobacteria bacterium]
MKQVFAAALALTSAISFAQAADVGSPAHDWSGPYVGILAGTTALISQGQGNSFDDTSSPAIAVWNSTNTARTNWGASIGGQLGYNTVLSNNMVLGAVGDLSWTGNSSDEGTLNFGNYSYHRHDAMDAFGTVRAKLGMISGDTLFSVSGGLALGDFHTLHQTITCCPTLFESNIDGLQAGWVVGAGVDHAVSENVVVNFEALYANFPARDGTVVTPGASASLVKLENSVVTLRAGISYKF